MYTSLIAYIPVINRRHLEWFRKYPGTGLYLISQKLAESLVPRLERNIGAIGSYQISFWVNQLHIFSFVEAESLDHLNFVMSAESRYILPDEDVSHAFVEKYIPKEGPAPQFDQIWARYDMTAIKRQSPVIKGVEIVTGLPHTLHMLYCQEEAPFSSDWWRQVGAAVVVGHDVIGACNEHFPTEYSPDIMGDPRMNSDAGQVGKYTSFHAEKAAIIKCAAKGLSTQGASLYTTVFPCEDCARAIVIAGIKEVYFQEGYSVLDAQEVLETAKVKLFQVKTPESA